MNDQKEKDYSVKESRAAVRQSRDYKVLSNGSIVFVRANHVFVFEGSVTFTDEGGLVAAFSPENWTSILPLEPIKKPK